MLAGIGSTYAQTEMIETNLMEKMQTLKRL